jgi:hypothetical protein
MKRTIEIILDHGPQVGTLRYDLQGRRENAAFAYSAGWLGDGARFALGPTLPLLPGPQFHRKSKNGSLFHAAIADTEPDGWGKRVITRDHVKRLLQIPRDRRYSPLTETRRPARPIFAAGALEARDDVVARYQIDAETDRFGVVGNTANCHGANCRCNNLSPSRGATRGHGSRSRTDQEVLEALSSERVNFRGILRKRDSPAKFAPRRSPDNAHAA